MNLNGPEQRAVPVLTLTSNPFLAFLLLLRIIPFGNHFCNIFCREFYRLGRGGDYFGVSIIDYYIQVNYKELKLKVTVEKATKAQRRSRCIALPVL